MKWTEEKLKESTDRALQYTFHSMTEKLNKLLNSGCVKIEGREEQEETWVLPRQVILAVLQDELDSHICCYGSEQYEKDKEEIIDMSYTI